MRELLDAAARDPHAHSEVDHYVNLYYPAYREGHLLVDGGLADQPARYVEMTRAIADLADRIELKYLELTKPDKENA